MRFHSSHKVVVMHIGPDYLVYRHQLPPLRIRKLRIRWDGMVPFQKPGVTFGAGDAESVVISRACEAFFWLVHRMGSHAESREAKHSYQGGPSSGTNLPAVGFPSGNPAVASDDTMLISERSTGNPNASRRDSACCGPPRRGQCAPFRLGGSRGRNT